MTDTRDLAERVPERQGVAEVDTLAAGLNAMLARLEEAAAVTEAALAASRRFAADAGHELRTPLMSMQANLDVLARNPTLGPGEHARLLTDLAAEQVRLAALLDALQALARGDAGALYRTEPLDLADLADAGVQAAQARHPSVCFSFGDPGGSMWTTASVYRWGSASGFSTASPAERSRVDRDRDSASRSSPSKPAFTGAPHGSSTRHWEAPKSL